MSQKMKSPGSVLSGEVSGLPSDRPALIGDIGGTHARFALVSSSGEIRRETVVPTRAYPDLRAALGAYLEETDAEVPLRGAVVCAAGPLAHGEIRLCNGPWVVSEDALKRVTGAADPVLLNDFTAVALSIPTLARSDLRFLGGRESEPGCAIGVLGPGTGLGVSGAIPTRDGHWAAITGEGGHVSLAPATRRESDVVLSLHERFGHASGERVLSGSGIETLYRVLCELDGNVPEDLDAAKIALRGNRQECETCHEVVNLFAAWLGSVAGDLALTLGAKGGVYVAGGIIPKWSDAFNTRLFRERFEAKGRFSDYLQPIPTYLVTAKYPVFAGLAALATRVA